MFVETPCNIREEITPNSIAEVRPIDQEDPNYPNFLLNRNLSK